MNVPESRRILVDKIIDYGLDVWKSSNIRWTEEEQPVFKAVLEAIDDFEDAVREDAITPWREAI